MGKTLTPISIPGVIYKFRVREDNKQWFIDVMLHGKIESSCKIEENTQDGIIAALKDVLLDTGITHQLAPLTLDNVSKELIKQIQSNLVIDGQWLESYEKAKLKSFYAQVENIENSLDTIENRLGIIEERLGL
ncbi:MAG: hypothetical protein ACFFDT_28170 [Candidatus Hodarchaeota archaeon]